MTERLQHFIGGAHVQCGAIALGVNGDRRQPHLVTRTDDAHGNFTAIGDENLLQRPTYARRSWLKAIVALGVTAILQS